jgi:hypothetical protein
MMHRQPLLELLLVLTLKRCAENPRFAGVLTLIMLLWDGRFSPERIQRTPLPVELFNLSLFDLRDNFNSPFPSSPAPWSFCAVSFGLTLFEAGCGPRCLLSPLTFRF